MNDNPNKSKEDRHILIRRLFGFQWCIVGVLIAESAIGYYTTFNGFFVPCLLVGGLGGSIAMVNRIRSDDSEYMKNVIPSIIASFMPILYGGLMAGIVYLLFASEILSGSGTGVLIGSELFPAFNLAPDTGLPPDNGEPHATTTMKTFYDMRPDGVANGSKLLVWALLAGYSESFIVGILKQLETRISKDSKDSKDSEPKGK